jgi:hypothetical protein
MRGSLSTGMTLFGLAFLASLVFLAWRVKRQAIISVLDKAR